MTLYTPVCICMEISTSSRRTIKIWPHTKKTNNKKTKTKTKNKKSSSSKDSKSTTTTTTAATVRVRRQLHWDLLDLGPWDSKCTSSPSTIATSTLVHCGIVKQWKSQILSWHALSLSRLIVIMDVLIALSLNKPLSLSGWELKNAAASGRYCMMPTTMITVVMMMVVMMIKVMMIIWESDLSEGYLSCIWVGEVAQFRRCVGPVRRWGKFDSSVRQGIFLPWSTFGADSLTCVRTITCIVNICAHVKDPLVRVRFRWTMKKNKNAKTLNMHRRLGSATL